LALPPGFFLVLRFNDGSGLGDRGLILTVGRKPFMGSDVDWSLRRNSFICRVIVV